jgi:hypothetical protein
VLRKYGLYVTIIGMRINLEFLWRFLLLLIVAYVASVLFISRDRTLDVAITGGVGVIAYWFSVGRRPFRTCWLCRGTGRHRGRIFVYAHRLCPSCGGSGRHRRWGVMALYGDSRTPAEQAVRQAGMRRSRPR